MAIIWSNLVAGSALRAIAAAGVTRSARPRMSATMISLPIPFILAKAALPAMAIENPVSFARYMAETPTNYQSAARRSGCGRRQARHDERKREDDADWYREPSPQPGCTCLALATARRSASGSTRSSFMLIDAVDLKCRSVPFALSARGIAR